MSPPKLTRVVIADDHALVRGGWAEILRAQPDFQVVGQASARRRPGVGQASDGAEAVVRTRELNADIVLMDLTMPGLDGLAARYAQRAGLL